MQTDEARTTVGNFVRNRFMIGRPAGFAGDSDSLLDKGILDSTGVLELVGFLEETYAITVEDDEMVPENLDSIDNIAAFVARKRGGAA